MDNMIVSTFIRPPCDSSKTVQTQLTLELKVASCFRLGKECFHGTFQLRAYRREEFRFEVSDEEGYMCKFLSRLGRCNTKKTY